MLDDLEACTYDDPHILGDFHRSRYSQMQMIDPYTQPGFGTCYERKEVIRYNCLHAGSEASLVGIVHYVSLVSLGVLEYALKLLFDPSRSCFFELLFRALRSRLVPSKLEHDFAVLVDGCAFFIQPRI
jgi:hypothetical protein